MTKMTVKKSSSIENRKLVAVIGLNGMGLFLRSQFMEDRSAHINNRGEFQAEH